VVLLSDGRSAEDEATVASPVEWAVVRAGSEGKLSGESTGHQERGPDCPQQHPDQDPAPVNPHMAEPRRAIRRRTSPAAKTVARILHPTRPRAGRRV
jgi:hypothetical protein